MFTHMITGRAAIFIDLDFFFFIFTPLCLKHFLQTMLKELMPSTAMVQNIY